MIRRLALVLAGGVATLILAPAPATAVDVPGVDVEKCDVLGIGIEKLQKTCKKIDDKLGTTGDILLDPASGLKKLAMDKFNPANMIEEWAKTIGESSASLLSQMQKIMLSASKPNLANKWFNAEYLVMLGLGIILAAFALVRATAALARGGPEAVLLARSVFNATVLYIPVVACAPLVIDTLVQITYGLAQWFGVKASASGGDAITAYLTTLANLDDPSDTLVGGVLSLLVIAGATFLGALVGLFELMVATLGVYLLTLLLPPLIALGVYPPWRNKAWGVAGALVGVAFVPPVLFLAYWTVWGAFEEFGGTKLGTMESLGTLAFVCVATLAAVLAPLVVGYLLAHVVPDGNHGGHTRLVGGTGIAAAGAARTGARMSRMATARAVGRGSGGNGGGGGSRLNGPRGRHAGQPNDGGSARQAPRPPRKPPARPKDGGT